MRYKVSGGAEMTDYPLVRALCEPVNQRGPGFVGDIGEHSDVHPVQEIESNSTFPMVPPLINHVGAGDGGAQARRRSGLPQCRGD